MNEHHPHGLGGTLASIMLYVYGMAFHLMEHSMLLIGQPQVYAFLSDVSLLAATGVAIVTFINNAKRAWNNLKDFFLFIKNKFK